MLDDSAYIGTLDHSNGLGIIGGQPAQLRTKFSAKTKPLKGLQQITVVGMGGSAIAAEVVRAWLGDRLPVPLVIVREYDIPAYIGKQSLVVLSSYSGNTEEELAAAKQVIASGAQVVVVTAGGQLAELAAKQSYPVFELTPGYQPRLAVLAMAKALVAIIEQQGLLKGLSKELESTADWLETAVARWGIDTLSAENPAKQVAEELHGNAAVIYGGPTLAIAAMKWKIDLNENAKNLAFWNQYSEFNHNEILGWLNPKATNFKVVELHSNLDNPRINKRFELTNRLLSGKLPIPIVVQAAGETKLQQLLWAILLGDFVSAYLGLLNGIDPIPVPLIEKLKKELQ